MGASPFSPTRTRNRPVDMPELVFDYLVNDAANDGHDQATINCLLTEDPRLTGMWRWLMGHEKNESRAALHAFYFTVAALQAYAYLTMPDSLRKSIREDARKVTGIPILERRFRPLKSRKNGLANRQAIFLRAFHGYLQDYPFPVAAYGMQERIAVMASVLLDEDVASRHVSKLLKE